LADDLGIDIPHLRLTPGGWLATALDSPLIGVIGRERTEALELFKVRRAEWRELIARSRVSYGPCGIGWPPGGPAGVP
jgi:hypothetical protein